MNDVTMKRLLTLAEKTGDKVIVTDPAGESPYVLMTLDQYEALIGQGAKVKGQVDDQTPNPKPQTPEPKRTLLAAGKFRLPIQDGDLGIGAGLLKPQAQNPKPQAPAWKPQFPRKQAETAVREPAMAALDPEGEEQFFLEPLE